MMCPATLMLWSRLFCHGRQSISLPGMQHRRGGQEHGKPQNPHPVKNCGNFTGKMTASFSESFAPSSPATSLHCTSKAHPFIQGFTFAQRVMAVDCITLWGKAGSLKADSPSHSAAPP